MGDLYVFIDNSFLFVQGYKHAQNNVQLSSNKKPQLNYVKFRQYVGSFGNIRRMVLVGSELAGSLISTCQRNGFEIFTLPRFKVYGTARTQEKGVDQKIVWEIAKTIFTNKDGAVNKKIILCTGDKDFMPIFPDVQTTGWSFELWMWTNAYSNSLETAISPFGTMKALDVEWKKFIDIV
jgi:uncharacterized LabA/DUF88 family protein